MCSVPLTNRRGRSKLQVIKITKGGERLKPERKIRYVEITGENLRRLGYGGRFSPLWYDTLDLSRRFFLPSDRRGPFFCPNPPPPPPA